MAHVPFLLAPWLSPSVVWFSAPEKPSLSRWASFSLSSSPASVCAPSPFCGHHVPLCSPTPRLCSLKQPVPRNPSQPFQKGQGSPCIHPFIHAPRCHLLSRALPFLRLRGLTGFSVWHLDGRAGEAYRNRATASGSRGSLQLAGPLPHSGRPHHLPCSLWQESSESTNTTIEDEDTKGRGALPAVSEPPRPPRGPLH